MTRARKFSPEDLARKYIYDATTPPITLTEIADEYGISIPYLKEMAGRGAGTAAIGKSWTQQRREFRLTVGERVVSALADEWAEAEAALRRRMLETTIKMLDQFDKELEDGQIKLTAKDFAMIRDSMRLLLGDVAVNQARDEPKLINPDDAEVDPEKFAEALPMLKRLLEGGGNGAGAAFPRTAGDDAAPDAAGPIED